MANFNNIKHEIDQNVNTNGVQAITGAILNETLKDMIDEVDAKKQDTLVAGQNITIQGNVISATGGSGQEYYEGVAIDIDASNRINVVPSDLPFYLAGRGLGASSDGRLVVVPSDIAGTGLIGIDEGGGHLDIDPSVVQGKLTAGDGIEIDQNNEISVKAGTGLGFDANGYLINTGGGGGGTTYTAGDGIEIDSNDAINAKLGNGLQLDQNNNIEVDTTVVATQNDLSGKQDTLTAGSNISISGSTISATDTTYSAGNGLSLNGTTFSIDGTVVATQNDLSGKQDTLTASNGISIDASNNISVKAGTGLAFDSNGNLYATGGGGGTTYTAGNGIDISAQDVISVDASDLAGAGLTVDQNGALEVNIGSSLFEQGGVINVDATYLAGTGLENNGSGGIQVSYGDGLKLGINNELKAKLGSGLQFDANGAIETTGGGGTTYTAGQGINIDQNNEISVDNNYLDGEYLSINGGVLRDTTGQTATVLNISSPLGGSGIIYNVSSNNGAAITLGSSGYDQTTIQNDYISVYNATSGKQLNITSEGLNEGSVYHASLPTLTQNETLAVVSDLSGKQDTLTAGSNIQINGSTISATDTTYTAGSGISISAQNVISATGGGGGTSFTPGDALELDQNDNLNVLYGSGLTLNGNNELEVDPSSITGFLPLEGGQLQADPLIPASDTVLEIIGPLSASSITLDSGDSTDPNDPQGTATITMTDSNGYIQIKPTGISDGSYTAAWPSLSGDDTIATLSDIPSASSLAGDGLQDDGNGALEVKLGSGLQFDANGAIETTGGGGSYTAGNGIDITSGTISVDETYLDSVYLPIIGGSLENTSNHTDLRIDAPNAESDNFVDILSPGTGVPSVELGTDTNTQGEVESLKFKGDADIDIKYVGDNTTYTLSFPTLTQNETIATLSDIQGGGSYVAGNGIDITSGTISVDETYLDGVYLPLTGGSLKDTAVGATETLLDVQAPDSTGALSFSADTLAAMIQMSADRDDANVADGTTYGINFDNSGDVDILVKTVNPLDPTDISTTTYTQTFQQKSGTIALLSDITGGGTTYTAGDGINISAQDVISSTTFVNGTGSGSIKGPNSSSATGNNAFAVGSLSSATGNQSTAIGFSATASGTYSIAMGRRANAKSENSVAIGYASGNATITSLTDAAAFGSGAMFTNANEVAIGNYNISTNSGTTAEKTQFTVGCGTADNARANLIEAKQNKDIYIYGVGGFDGTNAGSAGVHTLQYAIANAGGGGGSSLWTSGTGTDSLVAPGTVSAGLTGDAAGTGAVSCGYDSNANGDYSFACGGASTAGGDYSFAANNGTAAGDYSAAFGTSGASGDRSFAAGDGSLADAAYSIALGGGQVVFDDSDPNDIKDAQHGVAIGDGSIVEGEYGTAIGGALSRGTGTVAFGNGSLTEGMYSTAFAGSSASGNYSFAASTGVADANAHYSTALGGGGTVGEGSLASGFDTNAYGYCSAALGYSLSTYDQADGALNTDPNAGEVALGRYNYSEAGIVFTVGCGYLDETDPDNPVEVRRNAIAITSDGSIYIKGAGGYLGQGITGADSLQTLLYNLNPQ